MSQYEMIDPILSQWAKEHSLKWYNEYQDTEVRTFYLNPDRRDRVQISVDVPQGEIITIRIGQNRKGLSRLNRIESITSTVSELSSALDKALQTANEWAAN